MDCRNVLYTASASIKGACVEAPSYVPEDKETHALVGSVRLLNKFLASYMSKSTGPKLEPPDVITWPSPRAEMMPEETDHVAKETVVPTLTS